jgi:hypothetical protein
VIEVPDRLPPEERDRRLQLYNEQAEIMLNSRFAAAMFGQQTGVTISGSLTGPVEVTTTGPDDEAIRAFILTFRMFFRDGDGISFRQMAEVYDDPAVPTRLRDQYHNARAALKDFLDGSPALGFNVNGELLKRDRILDVFLYGRHAHANPKLRAVYDVWAQIPMMLALLENEFAVCLAEFFNFIRFVVNLNRELLGQGDQPPQPEAA